MNRIITIALFVLILGSSLCLYLFLGEQGFMPQHAPNPQYTQGRKPGNIFTAKTWRIFNKSQDLTIYALAGEEGPNGGKNTFRNFRILESTRLSPLLATELRAAFRTNSTKATLSALCFFPHHGIRARHEGETVDLVICFQCGLIHSYEGETLTQNPFSPEGRDAFDAIFRRAGLVVPSGRK
jgi:hypothetical protein